MTLLLALLYPLAVQYDRQFMPMWVQRYFGITVFPAWARWICTGFALVATPIDVAANYSELALLTWDWPQNGEYTFSTRLLRLRYTDGLRGQVYRAVIDGLNYFAPNGKHV